MPADPYAGKSFASVRRFFAKYPKLIPVVTAAGVATVAYSALRIYGAATITDIPVPENVEKSEAIEALEQTKALIMNKQMKHLQGVDIQQLRNDLFSPK